jgi:putative flippase GtrA
MGQYGYAWAMPAAKKPKSAPSSNLAAQGAKFGLVGISNTIIDYAIYITASKLLNVPLDRVFLVKFFSGTVAMINSFYWNRRWTFRSHARIGQSGARFLVATLVSIYAIQPGMVFVFSATTSGQAFGSFWFLFAQRIGIVGLVPHIFTTAFFIKTVAFGMGVIASAIWNFTLYKLWAFKK